MGKKGSWFSAVKKAFRSKSSKSKENAAEKKEEDEKKLNSKDTKQRWSFAKSVHLDKNASLLSLPPHPEAPLDKINIVNHSANEQQHQKQQKHHALAIAAATAAAAEAAVAAAHAAAEVVRLTGAINPTGRPSSYSDGFTKNEDWAAIKIQTAFRGYLARRALRALRGLVRLQALVRGHTVRRQATLTLRCMQALVRVQARVRARRIRMSEEGLAVQRQIWQRRQQEMLTQKGNGDGAHDSKIWDDSLQSWQEVEAKKLMKQEAALKRERALAYAFAHQLWKSSSPGAYPPMYIDINEPGDKPRWGWSWLERWMAARPWEMPRSVVAPAPASTPTLTPKTIHTVEEKPAIKEPIVTTPITKPITTINISPTPKSINADTTPRKSNLSNAGTPVKGTAAESIPSTPPTYRKPNAVKVRSASPRGPMRAADEVGSVVSTARSTQSVYSAAPGMRFYHAHRRSSIAGSSVRDDDSLVSSPALPNYMQATQSARAKTRSASNPKQRGSREELSILSARKRLSFPLMSDASMNSSAVFTPVKLSRQPSLVQRSPSVKAVDTGVATDANQSMETLVENN